MGLINSSIVTTRKDRNCAWCNELIPKGSSVWVHSGVSDGAWGHSYYHDECNAASMRDRECRDFDEFIEHARGKSCEEMNAMPIGV